MSPGAANGAEVTPERASAKMKLTQKAHVRVGPVPSVAGAKCTNNECPRVTRWTVGVGCLCGSVSVGHKDKGEAAQERKKGRNICLVLYLQHPLLGALGGLLEPDVVSRVGQSHGAHLVLHLRLPLVHLPHREGNKHVR